MNEKMREYNSYSDSHNDNSEPYEHMIREDGGYDVIKFDPKKDAFDLIRTISPTEEKRRLIEETSRTQRRSHEDI